MLALDVRDVDHQGPLLRGGVQAPKGGWGQKGGGGTEFMDLAQWWYLLAV